MNEEDTKILENSEHIEKKDFNELKEYAIEDAKVLMPQMARDIKQLQWEKKILKDALNGIWNDLQNTTQLTPMAKLFVEATYKNRGVY